MDAKLLEAWGKFLINAAKGQEQIENLSDWFNQGLKQMSIWQNVFGQFTSPEKDPSKTAPNAQEFFEKSVRDTLSAMGLVSKSDHIALQKKCEELQQTVSDQEKTIDRLKMLLFSKEIGADRVMSEMESIIKIQTDQFNNALAGLKRLFTVPNKTDSNE